ncbi:hypothetical protein KC726_04765 [Candidatus Woesebacteria bacterium]|nr:hypothetical protein [Candidatus Woesebacteria bacterium]
MLEFKDGVCNFFSFLSKKKRRKELTPIESINQLFDNFLQQYRNVDIFPTDENIDRVWIDNKKRSPEDKIDNPRLSYAFFDKLKRLLNNVPSRHRIIIDLILNQPSLHYEMELRQILEQSGVLQQSQTECTIIIQANYDARNYIGVANTTDSRNAVLSGVARSAFGRIQISHYFDRDGNTVGITDCLEVNLNGYPFDMDRAGHLFIPPWVIKSVSISNNLNLPLTPGFDSDINVPYTISPWENLE